MKRLLDDYPNVTIVTRFLGTTTHSSSIFKTYRSIALQLHYILSLIMSGSDVSANALPFSAVENYNLYRRMYNDVPNLVEFIVQQLREIHRANPLKKVVILMDSLDQLTANDYANVNRWLLAELPPNVKVKVINL